MYKITNTANGTVYYGESYSQLGDGLMIVGEDGVSHLIAGILSAFKIVDLSIPVVDPAEWLIDIGPFYDRFGASAMAVLASTNATVQAIVQNVNIRKYVDLKRADVASGLAAIQSILTTAIIPDALVTSILTTPVAEAENDSLRKLYFPETLAS